MQQKIAGTVAFNSQYCSLTPYVQAPGDHTHLYLSMCNPTEENCDYMWSQSEIFTAGEMQKLPVDYHNIAVTATKETPLHG